MASDKPNFLLDLDQTIISGEALDEFDTAKHWEKSKKFRNASMEDYYIIFERPYLQKFLDFLFKNFKVSIWTAASKDYALFIIEKFVIAGRKDRKVDYIFFSYHCSLSEKYKNSSKSLSMLWDVYGLQGYTQQNTVILDDYDEVYKSQTMNCVAATPFEFTGENSEKDQFLRRLIPKLKKYCLKPGQFEIQKVNSAMTGKM